MAGFPFSPADEENIGRFHNMWGEGNADPGADDEDEDEDEDGAALASSFSYAGIVPLNLAGLLDRPSTDPIQWQDIEKRFGMRPYETPREEFCKTAEPLNQATLLYRWKGLGMERDIFTMFLDPSLLAEREKEQLLRKRQECAMDPMDPETLEVERRYLIKQCVARIASIQGQLERRATVAVEQTYANFRTSFREVERPLTIVAQVRLEAELRKWQQQYLKLTGQDGKNVKIELEAGETLRDMMRDAMKNNNHRSPSGYTLAEIEAAKITPPELPAPSVIEGEVMPKNYEREQ